MSCFIIEETHVDVADGVCVIPGGDAGDEGVVVNGETAEQVRDKLFIFKAFADGCQCVGEAFHLLEAVGSSKISLLDVGELHANLHNAHGGA
jgi:hypothetical protein